MIKRRFHIIISQGTGRQLLWLAGLCLLLFFVLFTVSNLVYGDLGWQEVLALFLDPGCFGGPDKHDYFRLLVALVGCFSFSALLVSVFSNVLDNIADGWQDGNVRYKHRDHTLILGSHKHLLNMLTAQELPSGDIVIMTNQDVRQLRQEIERMGLDKRVYKRLTFYHGSRDNLQDLSSVSPQKAKLIYIIGENAEEGHDSITVRCVKMLHGLCQKTGKDITAFALLTDIVTTEVMARSTAVGKASRLHVDYINLHEYEAEQLMVNTDFLPAIQAEDPEPLRLVIIGAGDMAHAVANTAGHMAHYLNHKSEAQASEFTLVAAGIETWARDFMAAHEGLFRLSRWSLVHADGSEERHLPTAEDGDYLDIRWTFIDAAPESSSFRSYCKYLSESGHRNLRIVVCHDDDQTSLHTALHLPSCLHDVDVAVYQNGRNDIQQWAAETQLFFKLHAFGPACEGADPLFLHRAERGKRVNYYYDRAYNNPPSANADVAWSKISESHKLSSIYCANAMVLRARCITPEAPIRDLCELEHRRWMLSVLLMGYQPFTLAESRSIRGDKPRFKQMKAQYQHADIAPFDDLDEKTQAQDQLFIEHSGEILDRN